MIDITRLNDREITVNSDLIEMIEVTPDTTISLTTGRKIIVKESKEEVIAKIIEYKRKIVNTY